MLCLKVFNEHMRPIINKCPLGSKKCDYVHKLSKLKTPDGYCPNDPLPAGTATNLQCFECHDWGSGHADRPVFNFAFEETFPTKATTFVKKLAVGELKKHMLAENQTLWASVCYNFNFYGKCSYWGNCDFLHVTEEAAAREFSKHRCKCGTNGGICRFSKCKYPHSPNQLWIPEEFETSAYEKSKNLRTLTFYDPDTKQDSTCTVSEEYIAKTPERNKRCLCSDSWCNDDGCRLGVHLCPEAWFNGGIAFTTNQKPALPLIFSKKYRQKSLPARAKARPPRANAWAKPDEPRPSLVGEIARVDVNQEASSSSAQAPDAWDDDVTTPGSTNQEMWLHACGPEAITDEVITPEDDDCGTMSEMGNSTASAENASFNFIDLLHMTPVSASKFKDNNLKKYPTDKIDKMRSQWNGGLIERYSHLYEAWFGSMQMQDTYLSDGGVLTHSSLKIGEGFAADVRLGIMPSDGREVAVKIFHAKDEADKHFTTEVEAMKKYSTLPGTVPYVTSFEYSYEDKEDATVRYRKVVVLELMEGTLHDVIESWVELENNPVGTSQHLLLVRFVVGSMLQILARLNHGAQQNLVHRDVKPENIMVDRNRNIRLADFGISRVIEANKSHRTMSCSGAGTHIYGSPEAKKLKPYAHKTSDLYSLGMVAQAIATGSIPDMEGGGEAPATWPEHHRQSYADLVKQLLVEDPNKRAYIDFLKPLSGKHGGHLMPHDLMLSHPFFWSSQKCINFLVTLGNYQHAPFDLQEALQKYFESLPIKTWFDKVQHLEQDAFPTEEHHKANAFGLLKFMRHKYVHMYHRTMEQQKMTALQDGPVFLSTFPGLVICCWSSLLCVLDRIFEDIRHTQLQSFYSSPYDGETARRSQIGEAWL